LIGKLDLLHALLQLAGFLILTNITTYSKEKENAVSDANITFADKSNFFDTEKSC